MKAWDKATRWVHWLLVGSMLMAWASAEFGTDLGDVEMRWHRYNGYFLLSLVITRFVWGLVGSSTVRFGFFLQAPGRAFAYLKALTTGAAPHYLSHNPAGGWMVMLLLVGLLAQAGLGLFASDELFVSGPLASLVSDETSLWLTSLHETLFNILLVLVALHIAAVLYHQLVKHEKLVQAMFSGEKAQADFADLAADRPLRWEGVGKAAIILGLVLIGVFGVLEGVM